MGNICLASDCQDLLPLAVNTMDSQRSTLVLSSEALFGEVQRMKGVAPHNGPLASIIEGLQTPG